MNHGRMRIAVLGAGSWGTALAATLADAGHEVSLWGRDPAAIDDMRARRENRRYLPGRRLGPLVDVTASVVDAVAGCDHAIFALPAASVRNVARRTSSHLAPGMTVVCASKGLDEESCATLDCVLGEALPGFEVVLLSGPTFAIEIAAGLPAAAVAAARNPQAAARLQRWFSPDRLRIYTSEDMTGVALGGALKNVIAIAAGCSDGLGFGHNARAALITRALHEMGRLVVRLGGNPITLSGLAGLGDLVLTCTGELSRNRRLGLALARGEPLPEILGRLGQIAEGIHTARLADRLARSLGVDMPITAQVAAVLAGQRSPREAVADLLAREQGPER